MQLFFAQHVPLFKFSLRSCRSSSVDFFYFSQGNWKIWWEIWREFSGIFLTHRTKAQKFRGKFRSIFRKKIRGSKKIFRAKFTLQTCHLKFIVDNPNILRHLLLLANFVYFLYFFCISVLRGIWGVFRGVFWGSGRFCILYGDRNINHVFENFLPQTF